MEKILTYLCLLLFLSAANMLTGTLAKETHCVESPVVISGKSLIARPLPAAPAPSIVGAVPPGTKSSPASAAPAGAKRPLASTASAPAKSAAANPPVIETKSSSPVIVGSKSPTAQPVQLKPLELGKQRNHKADNGTESEHATKKEERRSALFIPPPPPTIPASGQLSLPAGGGAPIEFMSESELKKRQTELNEELSDKKKEVAIQEKGADDKRQRSTLFASLYTEGVVSRRELEASQHDDIQAQDDLRTVRRSLDDLRYQLSEIDARLKRIGHNQSAKSTTQTRQNSAKRK